MTLNLKSLTEKKKKEFYNQYEYSIYKSLIILNLVTIKISLFELLLTFIYKGLEYWWIFNNNYY